MRKTTSLVHALQPRPVRARAFNVVQCDDADVVNALARQLRGNTGLLALCREIRDCDRRVHMSAATWQWKHAASRTGGRVYYKYTPVTEHMLIQREREGPQHGQEIWEVAALEKGVRTDAVVSYWE